MSDEAKRGRFADLVDAIHRWWTTNGDAEPEGRKVDEAATRALPDPLNASGAVDEDRRRKKRMIDDALAASED